MGKSAVDFLRLGNWDVAEHTFLLADMLNTYTYGWEPGKWLQYHGWKREGVFIGTGEQGKDESGWAKRHSIVDISGFRAEANYKYLLSWQTYYATRIDLQITIPKPKDIFLLQIYDELKDLEIKTSIIQSEKNDTLYVGARTSEVFTRLYEKPLDEMYLRLEFEFKGKTARSIWHSLRAKSTVDEIFQYFLSRSKLPDNVKRHFFAAEDGETQFAIRKEIEKTDAKKLAWLQSCDASVRQAMYNHNIGEKVRNLVMAWANEASNVDIIDEID